MHHRFNTRDVLLFVLFAWLLVGFLAIAAFADPPFSVDAMMQQSHIARVDYVLDNHTVSGSGFDTTNWIPIGTEASKLAYLRPFAPDNFVLFIWGRSFNSEQICGCKAWYQVAIHPDSAIFNPVDNLLVPDSLTYVDPDYPTIEGWQIVHERPTAVPVPITAGNYVRFIITSRTHSKFKLWFYQSRSPRDYGRWPTGQE